MHKFRRAAGRVAFAVVLLSATIAGARDRELKLLTWDPPRYPFLAAAERVQGLVNLRLTVGADGRVQNVEVLGGQPMLKESAIDAARKLVFDCSGCQPGQNVTRDISFKYQIKGKPTEERQIKARKRGEGLLEVTLTPPLPEAKQ